MVRIHVCYVGLHTHLKHENLSSSVFGFCSKGMANVPEAKTPGSGLCVDDKVVGGSLRVELGCNLDTKYTCTKYVEIL